MSGSEFQRTTQVFLDRNLSPAAQSQRLAQVAKQGVAELVSSGRASSRFTRYVDAVAGAPEEAVKPGGVIAYEFSYLGEITAFALDFLRGRSPVGGGRGPRFRDSFWVAVNGRVIRASGFQPQLVPPDAEVVLGNYRPYNRQVDVQMIGGQPIRFSTPPGLYTDAAAAVRKRFGNAVTAKRVYTQEFPGQWVLRGTRRAGKRVESPALVIGMR